MDWLLCDLVEDPHRVLGGLVRPWLEGRRCRAFVVNLKFGRVDPLALLRELRSPSSAFASAAAFRIRHLYHDREELTVVGFTTTIMNDPGWATGRPDPPGGAENTAVGR